MNTVEIGLTKTTRKHRLKLPPNKSPHPQKNQNPSTQKNIPNIAEDSNLTPKRKYLQKTVARTENGTLHTKSTTPTSSSSTRRLLHLTKNVTCKKCIPDQKLQKKEKEKLNIWPVKSTTSSLVKDFEQICISKNENSDISIVKFENFEREQIRPMRCSHTTKPRLNSSVTKYPKKMHLSDWGRNSSLDKSSESGEGLFGAD